MRALRTTAAAWLAGGLLLIGSGAAQAYPDGTLDIDVDGSVCSNATVPVTVDASGTDAAFTITFADQTKQGSDGSTFTTSVKAPAVSATTTVPLSAVAAYEVDGTLQTLSATASITVRDCSKDDAAADDAGALPDTGGLDRWWLVLGAGLVLAGTGVVVARRG